MDKRKMLLALAFLLLTTGSLIVYWADQHKIVSEDFDKLTITSMDNKIEIIEDKAQIARIISKINESPRSFRINDEFTYDYLPHGVLTFENETEKVQIGLIIKNGKTITKYWEIDTDLFFDHTGNR